MQNSALPRKKVYRFTTIQARIIRDVLERQFAIDRSSPRTPDGWLKSDIRAALYVISSPLCRKKI